MIFPLGIRREPYGADATAVELTAAPPEWSVSPAGDLLVGNVVRESIARRLSDLLSAHPQNASTASVHLVDVDAARAAVARGDDPMLYRAYRDALPPRAKPGARGIEPGTNYWFADLVIYPGGELPGSRELARSIGHWNTPAQLEVFQCLSGRVLMLYSERDTAGRLSLRYQLCGPGDLAAIPFGAWHLTAALNGPAAVFNIYTDAETLAHNHTSRDAAQRHQLKYHSKATIKIVVIQIDERIALTGEPATLQTYPPTRQVSAPQWVRNQLEPAGLAAFYQHASDTELARFLRHALIHAQQPPRHNGHCRSLINPQHPVITS